MPTVVDPERKQTLAQFEVRVNGSAVPPTIDAAIIKIVVDERLNSPTMLELHVHVDPHNPKVIDEPTLAEGKEIEVFVGQGKDEASLCVVKITSVEVEFDDQRPMLIVRGYDLSFALHRALKSRTFLNQSDSDIARKIAGECPGLTAKIEATTEIHPYVLQYNQTSYEFLLNRARRVGFELRVIGRELHFRKPQPKGTPVDLAWGVTLKRFSPRLSVAEQVDEVEVRGWDPKTKKELVSKVSNGNGTWKVGEQKTGQNAGKAVWGSATKVIAHATVGTVGEAKTLAQAELDDLTASFIQAHGECQGNPKIRVGSTLKVQGVGDRFSGEYYVTAARHDLSKDDGHKIVFSASTLDPSSFAMLLQTPAPRAPVPQLLIAVVTNNKDPDGLGRVKVKFPTLVDSNESFWARVIAPGAGKDRGLNIMPEVNDEVVVAFEHGELSRPFVLGGLWNGIDLPPKGTAEIVDGSGNVNQRIWRSRTGHLFVFDDTAGKEAIEIVDKTKKNLIRITSSDNKLEVAIEGDITVTSKTGAISMTAKNDIKIESQSGKVTVLGQTTQFEAKQSGVVKTGTSLDMSSGTTLAAKAGTSLDVSGKTAKLSGATVDVKGDTATSISGAVVKIN